MLESFRSKRNSMFVVLVFAAIIVVFIFWGVGPGGDGTGQNAVATVNGEVISVKDYTSLYRRETEYFKETLKDKFTDEVAEKMNLKQRALDILINRALAAEAARDEGVEVTTEEVQKAIQSIPQFAVEGAFDKDVYFKVLSSNRVKPADFEKSIEADIITAKMREKVVKGVVVTDEDVKAAYLRDNRKIDLAYIAIDPSVFLSSVEVTEAEAREFLKTNGAIFMEPARIKAFYAYADFELFTKNAQFTPEEIKGYYDKNPKEFEIPGAVKVRHILIRAEGEAPDAAKAKDEARKKAEDILKKIKGPSNFAALAKQFSQDPGSASTGGDLGWFKKGVMVKAFEDAAFSLKKGEVSPVVETEFGFHIILAEDKKEPGQVSLKEAEPMIKKAMAEYKGKNSAKEALMSLEKAFKSASNADELKKSASAVKGVKYVLTPSFTAEDKAVELAANEMLSDEAFALKSGEASPVIESPQGVYLIRIIERQDARVPDYEKIAAQVKKAVAQKKASMSASKKSTELLERMKSGEGLRAMAAKEKLKVEQTGFFSRMEGFMPKTGVYAADKEKFFELTDKAPDFDETVEHKGRYFLFSLNAAKDADPAGLDSGKAGFIKDRLTAARQEEALNVWIKGLREKAKIQVFQDKM